MEEIQPPRKELFAVISLLFFAPLISKQIKEEEFGFSETDKTYILIYTHKGNIILGITAVGMLLLGSSYIRKMPIVHTLSTGCFVLAALLICIGMASIFMSSPAKTGAGTSTDTSADTSADTDKAYTLATLISAYLPVVTTRERYNNLQHTQLVHKEGRFLRSIWSRISILFPHPVVLFGGLIVIFIRAGMGLVGGYTYLPFLDKRLSKWTAEPEERASYPISLLTGFHKKQPELRTTYGQLQAPTTRQYIFTFTWVVILGGLARLQLHTHTQARRFTLALFPYILIFCRYLIIYVLVHKLPYTPGIQDVFAFTAHASSHDEPSSPTV